MLFMLFFFMELFYLLFNIVGNFVILGFIIVIQSLIYKLFFVEKIIDGYLDILGVFDGFCLYIDIGQIQVWLKIDLDKVYNVKVVCFWY